MDVKVILVGDKHTGKSSFVTLYADTIGQERDLEVITHYLSQEHERVYFRQVLPLGVEEVGSLGTCDISEIDLKFEARASECSYINTNAEVEEPPVRLGPNDAESDCVNPFATLAPVAAPVATPVADLDIKTVEETSSVLSTTGVASLAQ